MSQLNWSSSSTLSYANSRPHRRPYNYPNTPVHHQPVMAHGRASRHHPHKQAPYASERKPRRSHLAQSQEHSWQMRGVHAHDTSLGSGSRSLPSHAPVTENPMMTFDDVTKPNHRRKTSCNAYAAFISQTCAFVLHFIAFWAHGWAKTEEDDRDDTEIGYVQRGEYGLFIVCFSPLHDRQSRSCVAVNTYYSNLPGKLTPSFKKLEQK